MHLLRMEGVLSVVHHGTLIAAVALVLVLLLLTVLGQVRPVVLLVHGRMG